MVSKKSYWTIVIKRDDIIRTPPAGNMLWEFGELILIQKLRDNVEGQFGF